MRTKSVLTSFVFVFAIMLSPNVFAGSYWGIGLGSSSWDLKPLLGAYELKDGPTLDVFFGVRNGNFGFEGELTASSHDWVGFSAATHHAANLIIAGIGYLPVGQSVDLYGKLGFDYWATSVDYFGYNYDGDRGISLVYGVGVQAAMTPTMSLRFEYKMMNDIGDGLDKGDLSQATLSLVFAL